MQRLPSLVLLLIGGVAVSGFTLLRGGAPFDEGIVMEAAARVARGQIPYSDFQWAYGPLQPYLLGSAVKLDGQSLLWWRFLRVGCDAGTAAVVYLLARRVAPTWAAAAAWLASICALAQPTSATPTVPALLCALGAVYVVTNARGDQSPNTPRLIGTALLVALASAWRVDFGLYALLACGAALVAMRGPRVTLRVVALAVASSGFALVAYAPSLVAVGPSALYRAVLGNSLAARDAWNLPFHWPWDGALKDVLEHAVPLLAVAGLGVTGVLTLAAITRRSDSVRADAVALVVLGLGCLSYLVSRPDEFHTTPLVVVVVVLAATTALAAPRPVRLALGLLVGLLLVNGLQLRGSALLRPPDLVALDVPVARGAEFPPRESRALGATIRYVRQTVPPGQPIYTVTTRSDLVRINQPLIYVLAERPNPLDREYGLDTPGTRQRQIIDTLSRSRPRAIVRWSSRATTIQEPNLRGRPSGSRALDRWIGEHFRPAFRSGDYTVLLPR